MDDTVEEQCNIEYVCIFNAIYANDVVAFKEAITKYPKGLNFKDIFYNTPLLWASFCGNSEIVQELINLGADHRNMNVFGQNALTMAAYSGDLSTCKTLIRGYPLEDFILCGILTPLSVAIIQRNFDVAKFFLDLEVSCDNLTTCKSETFHGICPMQLAETIQDPHLMALLRSKHYSHSLARVRNF